MRWILAVGALALFGEPPVAHAGCECELERALCCLEAPGSPSCPDCEPGDLDCDGDGRLTGCDVEWIDCLETAFVEGFDPEMVCCRPDFYECQGCRDSSGTCFETLYCEDFGDTPDPACRDASPDAGTPDRDAGPPGRDAGRPGRDAGHPERDAGSAAFDAGRRDAGPAAREDSNVRFTGSGCAAAPEASSAGGLALLGLVLTRRRRR